MITITEELKLELNKFRVSDEAHAESIRHNALKEAHMQLQKYIWAAIVVLGIAAQVIPLYMDKTEQEVIIHEK